MDNLHATDQELEEVVTACVAASQRDAQAAGLLSSDSDEESVHPNLVEDQETILIVMIRTVI